MASGKQDRRKRIIEVGLATFARDGFGQSSLREIARQADVSHATILNHFGSKAELLLEILQYRDDQWQEHLETIAPDPMRVLATVAKAFESTPDRAGQAQFYTLLTSEAVLEVHPANRYFTHRYAWLHRYFAEVFAGLENAGSLRPGLRPDLLARQLVALMDGLQLQWLYAGREFDMSVAIVQFYRSILTPDGCRQLDTSLASFGHPVLQEFDEIPAQPDRYLQDE